ncbi:MAG TPA: hypothetical protein VFV35_04005, partial [Acidimicrobiales bacterium]|nr:hypothetical protein [Acidimicrobiales bacterium]
SAALDGEARGAALAEHMASCEACASRLATLRSAARLVATPVPPLLRAEVDEIVARATAAVVTQPGGDVVSIPAGSVRRQRPRLPAFASAAIAAVAAILVGLPVLIGALDSDEPAREQTSLASGTPADTRAAGGSAAATADAAAPDSDDTAAATMEDSSTAEALAGAAEPDLGAFEREEELTAALADPGVAARMPARAALRDDSGCETAARADGGSRLAALQRWASLVWRGVRAEVLVFELAEPADGLTHQAYVVDPNGCRVLAEPRF